MVPVLAAGAHRGANRIRHRPFVLHARSQPDWRCSAPVPRPRSAGLSLAAGRPWRWSVLSHQMAGATMAVLLPVAMVIVVTVGVAPPGTVRSAVVGRAMQARLPGDSGASGSTDGARCGTTSAQMSVRRGCGDSSRRHGHDPGSAGGAATSDGRAGDGSRDGDDAVNHRVVRRGFSGLTGSLGDPD